MERTRRKERPVTASRVALAACRELVDAQRQGDQRLMERAVVLARFAVAMSA